jgi:cytochrome c oxidase subunit 1
MAVMTLAMMGAGTLGVQRRHWDMQFAESALSFDYPASAFTFMGVVGVSGLMAILGGAIFVIVVVVSVFFGKPVDSESGYGFSSSVLKRAEPDVVPAGGHEVAGRWGFAAPGTMFLAIFFLVIFVLYYAVNWKYLASVWPMS